jgi:hypothetical protein
MGSFYTVQGLSGMTGQTTWVPFSVSYLDSPATTSATTYKLQFKTQSAGGCSVDVGNTAPSVVILQEVLV